MSVKLSTTVRKIDLVPNPTNSAKRVFTTCSLMALHRAIKITTPKVLAFAEFLTKDNFP